MAISALDSRIFDGTSLSIEHAKDLHDWLESVRALVNDLESRIVGVTDDLRFELAVSQPGPGASAAPDWVKTGDDGEGSTGTKGWSFPAGSETELFAARQLTHGYEEGTDLGAHLHVRPRTAAGGTVVLGVEYRWFNPTGPAPANTTILQDTFTIPADSAGVPMIFSLGTIDGADKQISSIFEVRIFRANAGTLAAGLIIDEFDAHMELDSLGSDQAFTKTL